MVLFQSNLPFRSLSFRKRDCNLFRFRSRWNKNPPKRYIPTPNSITPSRNCIERVGMGELRMANKVSLMNLIPVTAIMMGSKARNKATVRFV